MTKVLLNESGFISLCNEMIITEGVAEAIKSHFYEVKNICKDLKIEHSLSKREDGDYVSVIGINVYESLDLEEMQTKMDATRKMFLDAVEKLRVESSPDDTQCDVDKITFDFLGKLEKMGYHGYVHIRKDRSNE